jgi:hypothetical protein
VSTKKSLGTGIRAILRMHLRIRQAASFHGPTGVDMSPKTHRFKAVVWAILCVGVFSWACQDDPATSGTDGGSDCVLSVTSPFNCFLVDSVLFGAAIVGDSISTNFCIDNFSIPYGGAPIVVTVPRSGCSGFSWTDGQWTLQPGDHVSLTMAFHPTSTGVQRCTIRIPGCGDIRMIGQGVVEADGIPPRRPAVGVTNSGSYEAMVSVAFDYRTGIVVPWERDTLRVVVPTSGYEEILLPLNSKVGANENLIRDVEVHVEATTGVPADPWATVFKLTFPDPVAKCFRLEGTAVAPAWSEKSCSFDWPCGCF